MASSEPAGPAQLEPLQGLAGRDDGAMLRTQSQRRPEVRLAQCHLMLGEKGADPRALAESPRQPTHGALDDCFHAARRRSPLGLTDAEFVILCVAQALMGSPPTASLSVAERRQSRPF
jgi:hypothetical protein